jgi:hypothetical protein
MSHVERKQDPYVPGLFLPFDAAFRYMHAVDGRDAEIAAALSGIAVPGSSARLPCTIMVKHG